MKFKIKLSAEDLKKRVLVISGRNVIAILEPGEKKFHHKNVFCNYCGKCCIEPGRDWTFGTKQMVMSGVEETVCAKLSRNGVIFDCMGGGDTPWGCITECLFQKGFHPDCIMEYE